jgi:DNA-binding response OmpR family regulator
MLIQSVSSASSATSVPSVLLIENDVEWCHSISTYLSGFDFSVESINDGKNALEQITSLDPEVVILEANLPGKNGFEICRDLRASGNSVPLMVLGNNNEDIDHVLGLELGADDYQAKPIQPRVLLARIKALIRRTQGGEANTNENVLQFGKLRIQITNREVKVGDRRIELTPAEFDLLWLLASNAGQVMHRNDILKALRGLPLSEGDRSVDARLYRLRRRFEGIQEADSKIKSVRPHGYMFCLEPW